MRKMAKTMVLIVAMLSLFSMVVMAANQTDVATYMANGEKFDSADNKKPNDNDYKAYVTPLDANGNDKSTVFPNGGTLYARARLTSDPDNVYSPLFTFTPADHNRKSKTYGTGMAKFGKDYRLRSEVENCKITKPVRQWIRWCP